MINWINIVVSYDAIFEMASTTSHDTLWNNIYNCLEVPVGTISNKVKYSQTHVNTKHYHEKVPHSCGPVFTADNRAWPSLTQLARACLSFHDSTHTSRTVFKGTIHHKSGSHCPGVVFNRQAAACLRCGFFFYLLT